MRSKKTATILSFFLGGLGIHRFYLGQTGLGVLYFVFCWTFIPAFIALIDFIVLLSMSEETFNQKYNFMGNPHSNGVNSSSEEIKKLYELKEKGIITQEEFDLKKKTTL
ncbi:NINE protein [Segatella maculosa]|uniref:NINE protein n=1 Tax=Segatella maculosa TaxID=439703 RepID=UPI000368C148|nr:NINE protein [Segatella maculosa]